MLNNLKKGERILENGKMHEGNKPKKSKMKNMKTSSRPKMGKKKGTNAKKVSTRY